MEDVKQKITAIVEDYRLVFPEEYSAFLEGQKIKEDNRKDKFGELGADYILRGLVEVPETLNTMFRKRLSDEDYIYYDSLDGKKWFGNTFKEFLMTGQI